MTQSKNGDIEFIQVQSRFSKQATRKGGVSEDDAVESASLIIEQLDPEFFNELANDIRQLGALVDQVKKAGGGPDSLPLLEQIYNRCRRVRDLGDTFGYALSTQVADRFCEMVYRMRHAGTCQTHEVETCYSALKLVSTPEFKGTAADSSGPLLAGLDKVVGRYPRVFDPKKV